MSLTTINAQEKVTYLKKGEVAKYDGYLFSPDSEKRARKAERDLAIVQSQKLKLEQIGVLQDERIGLYRKSYEDAEKARRKAVVKGNLATVGGFVLGVSLSALASYAILRTLK